MSSNLDGFVKTSKPPPKSLATSQEIRDRGSTFVATVYAASSSEEARRAVNHLKHVMHGARPASHEIAAWRCMVLQASKSGLGSPDDFEVVGPNTKTPADSSILISSYPTAHGSASAADAPLLPIASNSIPVAMAMAMLDPMGVNVPGPALIETN